MLNYLFFNSTYFAHFSELRAKLFQFSDNYRPPYYGTWRKKSTTITGRRPWGKDENLDYEVEHSGGKLLINGCDMFQYDSDDEWEAEPSDAEECKSDEEVGFDLNLSKLIIYNFHKAFCKLIILIVWVIMKFQDDDGCSDVDDEENDGFFVEPFYLSEGEGEDSESEKFAEVNFTS